MDAHQVLTAVFGPLQWQGPRALTSYRGETIQLDRSSGPQLYRSTSIALRIARPIELVLYPAGSQMAREFTPVVRTGDPAFDTAFHIQGSPPDVIAGALDPALRQRLLKTKIYPGVRNSVLDMNISYGVEGTREVRNLSGQYRGLEGPGDPDLVRTQVDLLLDLIGAIRWRFDETQRRVAETRGPAAAQAWLAEQKAALGRASSAKARAIAIACIPAAILMLVLVIGGIVFVLALR